MSQGIASSTSTVLPRAAPRPVLRGSQRAPGRASQVSAVLTSATDIGMASERFDQDFITAVRSYQEGSWQLAFGQLTQLADSGHAPAAKLALLMLRYGSTVYGRNFTVRPTQIARWAQYVLAASGADRTR